MAHERNKIRSAGRMTERWRRWMAEADDNLLHYAVGVLCAIHEKYGDTNIVIYYGSIRVKIENIDRHMIEEDL